MSAMIRHPIRALLLACVALAAAAPAGASLDGQAAGAAASSTYTDATGDSNGAPDITGADVSNDAAGVITMRIAIPNRAQLGSDDALGLWIDADANEFTGPFEYRIFKFSFGAFLDRWDGAAWQPMAPPGSLVIGWQSSQLVVAFNRADLGIGDSFGFSTAGVQFVGEDPSAWPWDDAPDSGSWSYTLDFAPTLGPAKVQPTRPRAGRLVSVAVPVTAGGKPVDAGTVKCTAVVGGKQLRVAARGLNGGTAGCAWRLPASAAGKTLRGQVSVTTTGGAATRSFSVKVR